MTDVLDASEAAAMPIWTCDEVAAYLRWSRRKLDYMRKREDFPRPIPGGGHPRFRAVDIIEWSAPQPVAA